MSPSDPVESPLHLRRVAVYVSGSIAAYKACEVVTSLRKLGAQVRVAMTPAAAEFVTPMTFQSLSGNPVITQLWRQSRSDAAGHGMEHITLAAWAELQVAVGASADLLARLALGLADDAVTTTALACTAPVLIAPAMEPGMWDHPATQAHVTTLRNRGALIIGPVEGRLASGQTGAGRMAEPSDLLAAISELLSRASAEDRWLSGTSVIVTAGGTREPIDPIRFVGNRSSGKMGNALAEEALRLGARVTLITAAPGPASRAGLRVVPVETAADMLEAVRMAVPDARVLVMAAAVADYRPGAVAPQKVKKTDAAVSLELAPVADILQTLRSEGALAGMTVVGFAAETEALIDNARRKLRAKQLDLIVANDVGAEGVGMGADDNAVVILDRQGVVADLSRSPKAHIAAGVFAALRATMEGAVAPVPPFS